MSDLKIQTAEVFEPLLQPSRYKGAHGGRGSGKSHFFAELALELCILNPGFRIVCIREVQKTLKESVKRLLEDKIKSLGLSGKFRILTDSIETPGGGVIVFQGMQDHNADSIKSLEGFDVAYVEEAQTLSETSLELLRPTIRKPGSEIWFAWNPRSAADPVDAFLRGSDPPKGAIVVEANWRDNPFFPDVLHGDREHDKRNKPDRYPHIWDGAYEPAVQGAIWSREMFRRNRLTLEQMKERTDITRVVVGVDHATSSDPGANEHGIVVVGLGEDGRAYVLEDASTVGTPKKWGDRAIAMYDKWDGDTVVIERNQGGDLVASNLKGIRESLPVTEVTATKGKHVRAEPISAQYENDKVSHVGTFDELEDQMTKFTAAGYEGEGSPDRTDALVWALTELFPQLTVKSNWDKPINYPSNHMSIA